MHSVRNWRTPTGEREEDPEARPIRFIPSCRHLASVNASLTSKNTNLNSEVQRVEKMAAELSQVQLGKGAPSMLWDI